MATVATVDKESPRNMGMGIEVQALRRVIKENWKNKLPEVQRTNGMPEILDAHATKMERILNAERTAKNYDYESYCMQNIINAARTMNSLELKAYLSYLEKLAVGYQQQLGGDLTDILLIGLTAKARDLRSVRRYHDVLFGYIEKQLNKYVNVSEREAKSLRDFSAILSRKERSPFRFFNKREIALLRFIVAGKRKRISRVTRRVDRYVNISHRARHT